MLVFVSQPTSAALVLAENYPVENITAYSCTCRVYQLRVRRVLAARPQTGFSTLWLQKKVIRRHNESY